jgi:ribosomal protein S18 acetylase RimI-like enzyme
MIASNKIKQYGWINSIGRIIKGIFRQVGILYETYYLMANNINPGEISIKMSDYTYEDVTEIFLDDFLNTNSVIQKKGRLNLIKDRFECGYYNCFGIYKNKRLVFSCWTNTNTREMPDLSEQPIDFGETDAFVLDAYCHPDYRDKGYHSKMILYRLKKLNDIGKQRAFSLVICENVPSIKALTKCGFYKEKKIRVLRIFGRGFYKEKDLKCLK